VKSREAVEIEEEIATKDRSPIETIEPDESDAPAFE
jgi:hypothetical protein